MLLHKVHLDEAIKDLKKIRSSIFNKDELSKDDIKIIEENIKYLKSFNKHEVKKIAKELKLTKEHLQLVLEEIKSKKDDGKEEINFISIINNLWNIKETTSTIYKQFKKVFLLKPLSISSSKTELKELFDHVEKLITSIKFVLDRSVLIKEHVNAHIGHLSEKMRNLKHERKVLDHLLYNFDSWEI